MVVGSVVWTREATQSVRLSKWNPLPPAFLAHISLNGITYVKRELKITHWLRSNEGKETSG